MQERLTYAACGVDIDAANRLVERIKELARSTYREEVLAGIGGFAGMALIPARYRHPVLVASTDGVGTKLKVAFLARRYDTVGIDLVAMCVNDLLVTGAEPLFFLDYLAVGKLDPEQAEAVLAGIAAGCREAGCALLGGETAEMPGFYPPGELELAGFAVGVVERDRIVDGRKILPGEVVVGLPSSGLHANGFSLVRKLFLEMEKCPLETYLPELGRTLGEELLVPTRIYVPLVLPLLERFSVHGMAHITGGGLLENIPRVLPPGLGVVIELGSWPVPPIFRLIQQRGNITTEEMCRTFNLGIGFVLILPAQEAEALVSYLTQRGEKAYCIGRVVEGVRGVKLEGSL
ncbi:phosphoribosylformylglycinamidine cyclo-ligase [Ammonifex thiophilus]|uniref:Phosphoribosylformylglycinamidine cyclo-ligase n=1 Tax=Ammonifex thiophilus TaxID=444093 RepID=A0A3D8P8S3_9THEO|nr:phosphoribosylformylglycinamidine cyclo-ligase [Ammonifex thiophilus]RDV84829.1 phosphoribosylformylglycinamidine cyclo-ligase [Ammonifex thiophilus]